MYLLLFRFVDLLGGKMKLVLMLLTVCGVACIIWVILITMKVIALNLGKLMSALICIYWRVKQNVSIQ